MPRMVLRVSAWEQVVNAPAQCVHKPQIHHFLFTIISLYCTNCYTTVIVLTCNRCVVCGVMLQPSTRNDGICALPSDRSRLSTLEFSKLI